MILASKSPRRAEILRAAGWAFDAVAANIDETRHDNEDAVTYVRRLAQTKAETIARQFPHALVLGADTIVLIDEEILGQPGDAASAERMLKLLSGKWHQVLTGVALIRLNDPHCQSSMRSRECGSPNFQMRRFPGMSQRENR